MASQPMLVLLKPCDPQPCIVRLKPGGRQQRGVKFPVSHLPLLASNRKCLPGGNRERAAEGTGLRWCWRRVPRVSPLSRWGGGSALCLGRKLRSCKEIACEWFLGRDGRTENWRVSSPIGGGSPGLVRAACHISAFCTFHHCHVKPTSATALPEHCRADGGVGLPCKLFLLGVVLRSLSDMLFGGSKAAITGGVCGALYPLRGPACAVSPAHVQGRRAGPPARPHLLPSLSPPVASSSQSPLLALPRFPLYLSGHGRPCAVCGPRSHWCLGDPETRFKGGGVAQPA